MYRELVARRADREPLQHLLGSAPFRYEELRVGPGVFVPRPETEQLVMWGLSWLRAHDIAAPRVVDLCAGSGAIAVSVAAEKAGVAVVAVEMKLIGELHEVYRQPVPGTGAQRAVELAQAWAHQRGVNPLAPGRGVATALGVAARKELRDRLLKRMGRNLTTLGPLLTGAAVAGFLNRKATQSLGDKIRTDLARKQKELSA